MSARFRAVSFQDYRPVSRRRIAQFWDFSCRNLLFLLVFIFLGYKLIWYSREKCVTFELTHLDVSDQLLELCAGISMAWRIGRKFYVSKGGRHKNADQAIENLKEWFPKLRERIKTMPDNLTPMYVPFTTAIMEYPDQLANHRSECLQMDKEYSYDTGLFDEYQQDLRNLLEFSEEVKRAGEEVLAHLKLPKEFKALCVHIGRATVADAELDPSLHEIVKASREIAKNNHLRDFYVFSDDQKFAKAVVKTLQVNSNWQPHVHVANFSKIMQLYVARHVCGAVLLTSSRSKQGWWMGFLAQSQKKVFYMSLKEEDGDDAHEGGAGVQLFLPSWTPYTNWKRGSRNKAKEHRSDVKPPQ